MDTGRQPLHQVDGEHYIKPIQHMLAGFKNFDPATEKKLACHPDLPTFACRYGHRKGASVYQQAVGDLTVIAYYYLLRIGEYTTKTRRKKKTRTRQFRAKDVTFFKLNEHGRLEPLPKWARDSEILAADAATLRISNQKNGHAGACVHHSAIYDQELACPIKALARRIIHIRKHSKTGNAFLGSYWDDIGLGSVTDNQIRFAVKFAAKALNYEDRGMPIERMDTHSLRSGGACALHLAGYKDTAIQKMGRWAPKSTSFLEYIQQQLSSFSAGMAANMSKIAQFTNMEGNVAREDLRIATVH